MTTAPPPVALTQERIAELQLHVRTVEECEHRETVAVDTREMRALLSAASSGAAERARAERLEAALRGLMKEARVLILDGANALQWMDRAVVDEARAALGAPTNG